MHQVYLQHNALVLKVTGSSAERYLHGRCTQDIRQMQHGTAAFSLILSPQGQVEGMFFLYRADTNVFYIISSPGNNSTEDEAFVKNLLKFKVADQVEVEDVRAVYKVLLSVVGEIPAEILKKLRTGYEATVSNLFNFETVGKSVTLQLALISRVDKQKMSHNDVTLLSDMSKTISDEQFEVSRIMNGLPLMYKDVTLVTRAPDLPLLSFIGKGKGCYAGQEVVEMATARGKPNKKFIGFHSAGLKKDITTNTGIFYDTQEIGSVTSCVEYNGNIIGLGFVKNKEYSHDFSLHIVSSNDQELQKIKITVDFLS